MACGQHNRILAEERREIVEDALRKLEEIVVPEPTLVYTPDDPMYENPDVAKSSNDKVI